MARDIKLVTLQLSQTERTNLEGLVRCRNVGQALAQRAHIVLACAEPGSTNSGGVCSLVVSRMSMTTWRANARMIPAQCAGRGSMVMSLGRDAASLTVKPASLPHAARHPVRLAKVELTAPRTVRLPGRRWLPLQTEYRHSQRDRQLLGYRNDQGLARRQLGHTIPQTGSNSIVLVLPMASVRLRRGIAADIWLIA